MPAILHRKRSAPGHAPGWRSAAAGGAVAAAAVAAVVLALRPAASYCCSEGAVWPPAPPLTPDQRAAQQFCSEGAQRLHDVSWAVDCATLAEQGLGDGDPDCDLPPLQARRLNEQLSQAEQQCLADAQASTR